LEVAQRKIGGMEEEIDHLQSVILEKDNNIKELQHLLDSSHQLNSEIKANSNGNVQAEREKHEKNIKELSKKFEKQKEELTNNHNKVKKELEASQNKVAELIEEVKDLNDKLKEHDSDMGELKKLLEDKDNTISELKEKKPKIQDFMLILPLLKKMNYLRTNWLN